MSSDAKAAMRPGADAETLSFGTTEETAAAEETEDGALLGTGTRTEAETAALVAAEEVEVTLGGTGIAEAADATELAWGTVEVTPEEAIAEGDIGKELIATPAEAPEPEDRGSAILDAVSCSGTVGTEAVCTKDGGGEEVLALEAKTACPARFWNTKVIAMQKDKIRRPMVFILYPLFHNSIVSNLFTIFILRKGLFQFIARL